MEKRDKTQWIDMSDPVLGAALREAAARVLETLGANTNSPEEGLAVLLFCEFFVKKQYGIDVAELRVLQTSSKIQ